MTCLEYVLSKISKSQSDMLKTILRKRTDFLNKQSISPGEMVIFKQNYHVGFATLDEYCNLVTDECMNDVIFSRHLSLFDDNVQICIINPKFKKGSEPK